MEKGTLYLIPTPLSERELSVRVHQELLNSLNEFIIEDLKTARRNLRKLGFTGDLNKVVFHLLNEHTNPDGIAAFLKGAMAGQNIGLLSDAGMPCIADPGADLVRIAHQKGIKVVPLEGSSSLFLALAASGLNGQSFQFLGYLPKAQAERKQKLQSIIREGRTSLFIETPYRNEHMFSDILEVCPPDSLLCIAADVTGEQEFIRTLPIREWKKVGWPLGGKLPAVFILGK